jgi:glycosyltransferase involved in cell wall biosynthesis
VATSFVNETFGMALCEAMACGTPVVASNFGGFREVVLDGVSGYLTRPQNPRDISLKVNKLLSDQNRAKEMGEAGRRFVVENFSWKVVADRVEEAYRGVLRTED